jgi:integrase/recombinase XerC
MNEWTERFVGYLKNEKRFSANTVSAYQADLIQFRDYISIQYQIESISELNHYLIRSWIVSLMDSGTSARTANRKITTLKTFYRFLLREKVVDKNPMLKIQSPKVEKRLPVFLEASSMNELLEEIKFDTDFAGTRDKLILELFYGTGMRLSELIGIKLSDIDFSKQTIKVLGKRNKERIIPIHHTLTNSIKKYQSALSQIEQKANFLFVNEAGEQLGRHLVYGTVKKYLSLVTTLNKKSPHVLRHTFATHMLNNGADLNAIKEILGHANLAATQVYTHNSIEKLKNVHSKAHPKA